MTKTRTEAAIDVIGETFFWIFTAGPMLALIVFLCMQLIVLRG